MCKRGEGDAAPESGVFVGFEEMRVVAGGLGATGASRASGSDAAGGTGGMRRGCRQRERRCRRPVACAGACRNENRGALQNVNQLPSRSQAAGEEAAGQGAGQCPAAGRGAGKDLVYWPKLVSVYEVTVAASLPSRGRLTLPIVSALSPASQKCKSGGVRGGVPQFPHA